MGGQATDIEIHARDLIATRRTLAEIYEETTKKPIEQILKDIERDYYMTAAGSASDYGIIDHDYQEREPRVSPNAGLAAATGGAPQVPQCSDSGMRKVS